MEKQMTKQEAFEYFKDKNIVYDENDFQETLKRLTQVGFGYCGIEANPDGAIRYIRTTKNGVMMLTHDPFNAFDTIKSTEVLDVSIVDKPNFFSVMKTCPIGTILYSPMYGEVEYCGRGRLDSRMHEFKSLQGLEKFIVRWDGKWGEYGECMIWPSKEKQTWDDFDDNWSNFRNNKIIPASELHKLNTGDKVITRGHHGMRWKLNFFSHIEKRGDNEIAICVKGDYTSDNILPFNDETKHMLGTITE